MIIAVRDKRGVHRVAAQVVRLVSADDDGVFLEFVDAHTGDIVATAALTWLDLRTLCRRGQAALRRRRRARRAL